MNQNFSHPRKEVSILVSFVDPGLIQRCRKLLVTLAQLDGCSSLASIAQGYSPDRMLIFKMSRSFASLVQGLRRASSHDLRPISSCRSAREEATPLCNRHPGYLSKNRSSLAWVLPSKQACFVYSRHRVVYLQMGQRGHGEEGPQ